MEGRRLASPGRPREWSSSCRLRCPLGPPPRRGRRRQRRRSACEEQQQADEHRPPRLRPLPPLPPSPCNRGRGRAELAAARPRSSLRMAFHRRRHHDRCVISAYSAASVVSAAAVVLLLLAILSFLVPTLLDNPALPGPGRHRRTGSLSSPVLVTSVLSICLHLVIFFQIAPTRICSLLVTF